MLVIEMDLKYPSVWLKLCLHSLLNFHYKKKNFKNQKACVYLL